MADHWTRRARRWTVKAAVPTVIASLALLLVSGSFAQPAKFDPARIACWAVLVAAGLIVAVRQVVRKLRGYRAPAWWTGEACALSAIGALALTQFAGGLTSPLYPLVYLLGASYALALPLRFALPAIGWLVGLDAGIFLAQRALPAQWPLFAAHASFMAVFAALYHAVLATRLRAARSPSPPRRSSRTRSRSISSPSMARPSACAIASRRASGSSGDRWPREKARSAPSWRLAGRCCSSATDQPCRITKVRLPRTASAAFHCGIARNASSVRSSRIATLRSPPPMSRC